MDAGGAGWGMMTIIGPIILAAVILWAVLRNRTSKAKLDRTEQATRDLYQEEDRSEKPGQGRGPR